MSGRIPPLGIGSYDFTGIQMHRPAPGVVEFTKTDSRGNQASLAFDTEKMNWQERVALMDVEYSYNSTRHEELMIRYNALKAREAAMSAEARYDQLVIEDKTALARIQADLSKMENKFNTYVTNLEEENRIAQEKQNEHEDLKEEKRRLKKKLDEMIKDASSIMGFLRFFWAEIMKFFSGS